MKISTEWIIGLPFIIKKNIVIKIKIKSFICTDIDTYKIQKIELNEYLTKETHIIL